MHTRATTPRLLFARFAQISCSTGIRHASHQTQAQASGALQSSSLLTVRLAQVLCPVGKRHASARPGLLFPQSPQSAYPAGRRYASHQAQGRANGAKQGPGKRLGAKKTGGQYVVPGNILFKQRGVEWHAGENCFMGRDHTIHAGQPGYVRYYRDPVRHPKRQYIGVVFEKHQSLPYSPQAPRMRKLGMLAYQVKSVEEEPLIQGNMVSFVPHPLPKTYIKRELRPGNQYRVPNWKIGQKIDEEPVPPYKAGNRFAAWRRKTARVLRTRQARALGRGGKKKPAKVVKGRA